MAILVLPQTPAATFTASQFGLVPKTFSHTSDLDSTTQTIEKPGARWVLEAAIRSDKRAGAEIWATFLAELDGTAGRFYAGDPFGGTARGSAKDTPGTPLVAGAAQKGKILAIDGAPLSATGYLLVGDYVAVDLPSGSRSLHKLTAPANTDGGGAVSLAIRPALRESPANDATIIVSGPTCVFRLVDDNQARWRQTNGGFYNMTLSAIESFNLGL